MGETGQAGTTATGRAGEADGDGRTAARVDGRAVLAFERANPQRGALKDARIRAHLGLSAARYYQVLHRVVDTREALSEDPVLVHRLVRVRDRRASPFDIRGQDGA